MSLKIKKRSARYPLGLYTFVKQVEVTDLVDGPEQQLGKVIPSFTNAFTYSGNIVNYKFILNNENKTILNLNIDLDILKQNANFADQTLWSIDSTIVDNNIARTDSSEEYTVKQSEFVPLFSANYVTKPLYFQDTSMNGSKSTLLIFVPSKNSTIEELKFVVYSTDTTSPEIVITTTGDVEQEDAKIPELISTINISPSKPTINADDFVTLTITTGDPTVTEVYAEPVYGTTNKTRVRMVNGTGNIIVYSTDLIAGEPVRIKFGYKYYTGVAEYINTVT